MRGHGALSVVSDPSAICKGDETLACGMKRFREREGKRGRARERESERENQRLPGVDYPGGVRRANRDIQGSDKVLQDPQDIAMRAVASG